MSQNNDNDNDNKKENERECEQQFHPSYWSKKHASREAVIQNFIEVTTERSKVVLNNKSTLVQTDVSYGSSDRQKIDYFYCSEAKNQSNSAVLVYIHGGYWQEGDKEMYRFISSVFLKNNFNFALMGYDLAPSVTVKDITSQVIKAVDVINQHFSHSTKLILCGHSAGAFLSAAVATSRPNLVNHVILVSGVYNLVPLLNTSLNDALALTPLQVEELHSALEGFPVNVSACVYVGGDESPWFVEQSKLFHEKLVKRGVSCTFKVVDDEDHFSIIENLYDEHSVICSDLLMLQ